MTTQRQDRPQQTVNADEIREQIREQIQQSLPAATDADIQRAMRKVSIQIPGGGSGRPVIMVRSDGFDGPQIPRQVTEISIAFFICAATMVIGWPIARALGRRIERKSETAALPPGLADQLTRIEQAVDSMSIEVERISESQRYLAKVQTPER